MIRETRLIALKGHDFSRATKAIDSTRALAPAVCPPPNPHQVSSSPPSRGFRASIAAMACWALLSPIPASAADVQKILASPLQQVQSADFRTTGHLVRVQATGARISYPITIKAHWFPGVLRVLVDVGTTSKATASSSASLFPPAHILLEMRPNGQSVIKIAHPGDAAPATLPFEKWSDGPLGSGFSYEDFLEPQYFWANQTALAQAQFGARRCDVLLSAPGPSDRTHYNQVKTWLDKSIGFPVYVEKSLRASGGLKQFTYLGLRHDEGVWSASQIEVKTSGQAGSTLLIIDRGSAKANLSLKDFSIEQLTHFQDR